MRADFHGRFNHDLRELKQCAYSLPWLTTILYSNMSATLYKVDKCSFNNPFISGVKKPNFSPKC